MKPFCSVIIVTYNSQKYLPKAMAALREQTRPADEIILVDTGSADTSYLQSFAKEAKIVLAPANSGFCKGNNIGYKHISPQSNYVFLVNPDLFLTPLYLEKALAFMEKPQQRQCAALTGITLGYDIQTDCVTGRYDSTGVFSTWYGRWFDRGQGQAEQRSLFQQPEEIPAICGAVFFCRRTALEDVLLRGCEILDSTFYMYKEDIDLSLRLRNKGWKLLFVPDLVAYHCRGWSPERKKMPRWCRLCSARNELRIHWRSKEWHKMVYSSLKLTSVQLFDL